MIKRKHKAERIDLTALAGGGDAHFCVRRGPIPRCAAGAPRHMADGFSAWRRPFFLSPSTPSKPDQVQRFA
jgi:hypothetical protein